VFAALAGLSIIRVHDIATHMQALRIVEATGATS
jgi:dihydropteroate synthase